MVQPQQMLQTDSSYQTAYALPLSALSEINSARDHDFSTPLIIPSRQDVVLFNNDLTITEIPAHCEAYLQDCAFRLYSPDTIATRRVFLNNLIWFLNHKGCTSCDAVEIRHFFYYLMHGHESGEGRFGNKLLSRPVRPVTVRDYYYCFRSFFDWLVAQRILPETPFLRIAKPHVREEVKTALSPEQIAALLQATEASKDPIRNMAIVTFLLDTGCRANELVSIRVQDVDLSNGRCRILGKGNKYRTIFFG
jgi:site-specific recombinase XerD